MLKRIKLSGWITIILLLSIIITGMGHLTQADTNKTNNEVTDKKAEKQQKKKHTSSKYPGLTIKTEIKDEDIYTLAISAPLTEDDKINKSIQSWINKQKKNFMSNIDESGSISDDDNRSHLNIQVDTNKLTDDIYSLVFHSRKYVGGPNDSTTIKVFNVDLKNKKMLQMEDVLKINKETFSVVKKLVDEELQKNDDIYFYLIDDYFKKTMHHPENWKWSINKKEFTLYFDEYEIAAKAAGPVKVNIPLQELYLYLNDNINSLSKTPEKQLKIKKNLVKQTQTKLEPNKKYIALTFDNGPCPEVTSSILETLKEHQVTATFFMLGSHVDYYPEIVEQIARDGHEIGNHSMNHLDLTNLSIEQIYQDLDKANRLIEETIGSKPTVTRPPYGVYNDNVIKMAKHNASPIVLWSVDSLDFQPVSADKVKAAVQKEVTPGTIVLMHDIHANTANALPELLDTLEKEGYQFISVSQMLDLHKQKGIEPYNGKIK